MKTLGALLLACGMLSAQTPTAPNRTRESESTENSRRIDSGSAPIYRITVVARTTKAINYNHRSGSTKIGFRGTALMPDAEGEARVESKQGVIKINADMQKMEPATKFGPEYLTYVMWAITPEGRATNVGEVLLNNGKSKLDATSELQSFGLIVTAEPYFAVTQPSDVVVMENFVRTDTTGTIEQVDAKYELLQRGQYVLNVNPSDIQPIQLDRKVPLELYEARNAVQIARWTGAPRYASETFEKAVIGLQNAEGYLIGKAGSKPIGTVAREAVQMAEDSRIITIKKIDEEQLANERQAGRDRESRALNAQTAAQSETNRISAEADRSRIAAEQARIEAEDNARRLAREHDAETAAAQADAEKLKQDNANRMAEANSETDRLRRENTEQAAMSQADADRLKQDNEARMTAAENEADRLRRENDAQRAASQTELDRAAAEKAAAEKDKAHLRAALLVQFNAILQTRDSARGLIVNMSDVLFDTAKFSLRPAAREKLARVAGILAGHPGLSLQVEGFTDSVGGDDYNQKLSEDRAGSVRDYLTGAGIPSDSVTAKGFGEAQPVATNDTSAGRQQNRRVELVVSGDIIGMEIQAAPVLAER